MFIIIDMDKNILDCNWLKIGYEKIKIIVKRYDNDINFFIPLFYKIVSYNFIKSIHQQLFEISSNAI